MKAIARTDIGKVRRANEDSYLLEDDLFAVADGMGGHRGGQVASQTALRVVSDMLKGKAPQKAELCQAMEAANRRVYETQLEDESLKGMGTTLSVLWADAQNMHIGHVGDSRVYLLRQGTLTQLTQDHSLVAELMKNGYITAQEAQNHPYKNVVTRAVGTSKMVLTDVFIVPLQAGDRFLICSDGLHGMVGNEDISSSLALPDMAEAADKLMTMALNHGGSDNITFVICETEAAQ